MWNKLLSPKARKLIKRTSLLLQRANSSVEKNPENEEKSDDVDASLKVRVIFKIQHLVLELIFFQSRALQFKWKNPFYGLKEELF